MRRRWSSELAECGAHGQLKVEVRLSRSVTMKRLKSIYVSEENLPVCDLDVN